VYCVPLIHITAKARAVTESINKGFAAPGWLAFTAHAKRQG